MNSILKYLPFLILSLFTFDVSATCIGSVPVWGSGDTKASCAEKQAALKTSPRPSSPPLLQTPQPTSQTPQINQGAGSNFFMNGFQPGSSKNENQPADGGLILTIHQIRFELAPSPA